MATISITLPDSMKTFIEEQAAKEGFETVGEYLNAKIRDIHERERARREVRGKLLEAVRSGPATPMTEADWEDICREGMARIASRTGRASNNDGPAEGDGELPADKLPDLP